LYNSPPGFASFIYSKKTTERTAQRETRDALKTVEEEELKKKSKSKKKSKKSKKKSKKSKKKNSK